MKTIIKTIVCSILTVVMLGACSEDDKFTLEVQNVSTTRGAIVRTVSIEGAAFDVLDPTETVTLTVEEQDAENGELLQDLDIYVDLVDNTESDIVDPSEALLMTVPASEFTLGDFGLPVTTFSISQQEFAAALGLDRGDYNCGDQWAIRLQLNLTDGRSFTVGDAGGTVTGGSFFSSPFEYRVSMIAPLSSDDLYTGQYQLTTELEGVFGRDYLEGVYTIETINNTTKVIRDIPTLPDAGGFGPRDLQFELVCGEIIVTAEVSDMGAGCSVSIRPGPARVNSTYDLTNPDDSDFVINFASDATDDCGNGSVQAAIRLTKI